MGKRILGWFRRDTVLTISLCLAVSSCLIEPPGPGYLSYIDCNTLITLFCLMLLVEGLREEQFLQYAAARVLSRVRTVRGLLATLVFLCFVGSMLITNDVALITFVPLGMMMLEMASQRKRLCFAVALMTIAANLGSMFTPIGNPQNLYLYSVADMGFAQFAWAVLPYTGISLVLLAVALLFQKEEPVREFASQASGEKLPLPPLLAMLFCLALCLLVVFRVVGYLPVLVCVALVTLLVDRRLYGAVDYALLLTFLCFFIFVGNIKRLPEVNSLLQSLVGGRELWAGILASQVISNVPAAILLSGFTGSYGVLLTAVNLGGLGTPIASLASLISFKFCAREYPGQMGRFFRIFTVWNLLFLAVLTGVAVLLT